MTALMPILVEKLVARAASRPDASIGRGVSDEAITAAEAQLAARFPADYRGFLRTVGWYEDARVWINGLGEDCPRYRNVIAATDWERNQSALPLPQGLISISDDGAGNLYCLWVTEGSMWGQVVVVEAHRERPEAYSLAFLTFQEFVDESLQIGSAERKVTLVACEGDYSGWIPNQTIHF